MDGALGVVSKNLKRFSIIFQDFYSFVFRPINVNFEQIFVKNIKSMYRWSSSSSFQVDVQLFQQHCWKRLSVLHCFAFVPWPKFSTLFMGSPLYSTDLFVYSSANSASLITIASQ
jgi:hypothetical protein